MNLLKTKLQHLLFTGVTATLLTACGGSTSTYSNQYTDATGEEIELGVDNPICQTGSSTQEGHIIDADKKGLSNVTVEIAGCTTTTDAKGFYKFTNIPASNRTSVNLTKEGYIKQSEIITIKDDTTNFLEVSIDENEYTWSYKSQEGSSGEKLEIASNVNYFDQNGSAYNEEINVFYSFKDTTTIEGRDLFPGDFKGKDSDGVIVSFVSYGLMVLELKDKENNPLSISKPITINVKNIHSINDETIPLWYYNEDKGIWIEKGYAQRTENGKYSCEIPHTGVWSINKPIETEMGLYKGKIIDADENPLSNVRIQAKGKNWVTQDLTTDENGAFEVYVVPNEKFTLSAYDYKEKFGAEFPYQLESIAPGHIVEE